VRGAQIQAIRIPDEAFGLVQRIGGYQDYLWLFEAAGAGLSLVLTDPAAGFGKRWLGDPAIPMGVGLALSSIALEPAWLRERLQCEEPHDYLIIAALRRVTQLRQAAARVKEETLVWERGALAGGLSEDIVGLQEDATGSRGFPETYLAPLVGAPWSALDAATTLRAHTFAAQLREFLRNEYEEEWYKSPRAGRFLLDELWRPGGRYTADELARFMGFSALEPSILLKTTNEVLSQV
jgi:hypothetical protein